jgi:hypothetical protein
VRHKSIPLIGGLIFGVVVAQLIYRLPLDYPSAQILVLIFAAAALALAAAKRVAQRAGRNRDALLKGRPAFTRLRFGEFDRR